MDHQTKQQPTTSWVGTPPFDGAHPVRLALVIEIIDLLQRHGYQPIARRRSLADFLRTLNALVESYETSGR